MTNHRLLVACADGVRHLRLDTANGTAETIGSALPIESPLAITADRTTPNGSWTTALTSGGQVLTVAATADGVQAGDPVASGGAVPCHIAVLDGAAADGVAVANYTGHTVGVVRTADGGRAELGAVYDFGEASHPHQVLDVDGRLVVCDLGRDGLHVIDLAVAPSAAEASDPVAIPLEDGAGPRNAVRVGPDHLVVALEKANAAAVVELQRDPDGVVIGGRQVDRCAFSGSTSDTHPSQVLLDRDATGGGPARILVLNRGSDQLCVLEVADGRFVGGPTEHPLPAWPMDLARVGEMLLVACRDAEVLVGLDAHDLGHGGSGRIVFSVPVPRPHGIAVVGCVR